MGIPALEDGLFAKLVDFRLFILFPKQRERSGIRVLYNSSLVQACAPPDPKSVARVSRPPDSRPPDTRPPDTRPCDARSEIGGSSL